MTRFVYHRPPPNGPPLGMPSQALFPGGAQPPPGIGGPPPRGPMDGPPKPAFPAYQNMETPAASLPDVPVRQVSKVLPVGAGCKLIHPEDDLSMVSCAHVIMILSRYNDVLYK